LFPCYDFQIRSVAAPELCVDTENKKADERFGLKDCVKDNKRSAGEQVCIPVFTDVISNKQTVFLCIVVIILIMRDGTHRISQLTS
jgi:hypothetical protein